MKRMGYCGGNFSIPPRSRKPTVGQRRKVISVKHIVESAGMFRLRREHLLENRGSFQLPGEILVGRNDGNRFIESEGIEDTGLRVFRVTNVNLFHTLFVGQDPRLVVELLP